MDDQTGSQKWQMAIACTHRFRFPLEHFAEWVGEDFLIEELKSRGFSIVYRDWYDPEVDWRRFDLILMNMTWDYPSNLEKFEAWIQQIKGLGVKTINSLDVVQWNMNKQYLVELGEKGAPLIDTVMLRELADVPRLTDIMKEKGWKEVIVKPVIGNAAIKLLRVTQNSYCHKAQAQMEEFMRDDGGALVQPFLPAIETEGEWSLVYFNGVFSHAIRAQPQGQLGRLYCDAIVEQPPDSALWAANNILQRLPWQQLPHFARVDVLRDRDDAFKLVEMELIEPMLYLGLHKEAVARFADTIMAAVGGILALEQLSTLSGTHHLSFKPS